MIKRSSNGQKFFIQDLKDFVNDNFKQILKNESISGINSKTNLSERQAGHILRSS